MKIKRMHVKHQCNACYVVSVWAGITFLINAISDGCDGGNQSKLAQSCPEVAYDGQS